MTSPAREPYIGGGTAPRTIVYQGAIIRDHHILLIKHTEHATSRGYWLIPGGGIEPDPSTYPLLQRIRGALGYATAKGDSIARTVFNNNSAR